MILEKLLKNKNNKKFKLVKKVNPKILNHGKKKIKLIIINKQTKIIMI
jgi:hypothetical protein